MRVLAALLILGLAAPAGLAQQSDGRAGAAAAEQPRVRVVRPASDDAGQMVQSDDEKGWQHERNRRFHLAPKRRGTLDYGAPAPIVPLDTPGTDLRQGARLRQLDKMTGQTQTFEIGVGEARQVERLRIRLDACRSPAENDMHGTIAFLKIWDTKQPDGDAAFSGWMFAESPALSALDHPRYDLWVISCTTSAREAAVSRQ